MIRPQAAGPAPQGEAFQQVNKRQHAWDPQAQQGICPSLGQQRRRDTQLQLADPPRDPSASTEPRRCRAALSPQRAPPTLPASAPWRAQGAHAAVQASAGITSGRAVLSWQQADPKLQRGLGGASSLLRSGGEVSEPEYHPKLHVGSTARLPSFKSVANRKQSTLVCRTEGIWHKRDPGLPVPPEDELAERQATPGGPL